MDSSTRNVRLPGLLWFLSALTGGFGLFYVRSNIIVTEDAAATAGHIMASELFYRAAIVSSLVSQVFLFFFGLTLYHLFREFNKALARVFLCSVLLSVGIAVVNMLNHFGALMVLSRADYLNAFTREQLNAIAFMFLRLANNSGQALLEIFWAPYYFSFGLLVSRSGVIPKILGILLMIMGIGFAINILEKFLFPKFHPALFTQLAMSGGALGGIPTILWLLLKGARVKTSDVQASRSG